MQQIVIDDLHVRAEEERRENQKRVELRFFAGLAEPDVASVLEVDERAVHRDFVEARDLLLIELQGQGR